MRRGHRGYVASRPCLGERAPQHVQNLVIRDHARRHGLTFLLSATEYAMPGSFKMLETVLDELPTLDGVILYSLLLLPPEPERRLIVYRRVLAAGATLHAALESLVIADFDDARHAEDILMVRAAVQGG
ncbi:MAG: sporadic carbohydrate cluster protein, TIGR04323 family [Alphaproteobacteria bacterium]|nr:sporadic carbohydrate cluster protein, TIGR04323 family [Alphaproteobacteria bacterium]